MGDCVLEPDMVAFLQRHDRAFLLARRADGSPTGWPLTSFPAADGVEFSTYRKSHKVRDFRRTPAAACVVAPVEDERALTMCGSVDVVEDQPGPSSDRAPGETRNPKRLILRFVPAQARFVDGFGQDG